MDLPLGICPADDLPTAAPISKAIVVLRFMSLSTSGIVGEMKRCMVFGWRLSDARLDAEF